MIDPDMPQTVRFSPRDLPDFPDDDSQAIEARHAEERQRKQETLRWLHEHAGFSPFDVEW